MVVRSLALIFIVVINIQALDWYEKGMLHSDKGEYEEAVASFTVSEILVLVENVKHAGGLRNVWQQA